ncbi:3-isopropylmalate dehydratase large subunit [uncultured Parasphingorhabdus sp.]|uniref:3-isopropylmalate dehydratase large subunit n=1 Tax=uncultured Parasphingorhabdus sp. TaxID=2709694 RepID=UPI002AA6FDB3|nr:3-isopropylmalate dehydratase large subunit [uncultured Parasphingorhabdus sp.]
MKEKPRTLYDKIWANHVVERRQDGTCLIFIDRHLIHEVSSPQAFEGLRLKKRLVRRPDLTLAMPDHNLPTTPRRDAAGVPMPIADTLSAAQLTALENNARQFRVPYIDAMQIKQGIVHVVGPETGFSLPGATVVCGDSHTAAHGGIGALGFGIGTSEVEHVLATQTLIISKSKNFEVRVDGQLGSGVGPKDLILHIIGMLGAAGGTGHVIEYRGSTIESMSIEGRLTICNMSIEAGARAGLVAPDRKTYAYVSDREYSPRGAAWYYSLAHWKTLFSDEGAEFDKSISIEAADIAPQVTWGTSPQDVMPITGCVPDPDSIASTGQREAAWRSLNYMGLSPGTPLENICVENIFIGSCTNSRIEDLRDAARILRGRRKSDNIRWAIVVPGSGQVKKQAEEEGLHQIFIDAGLEWREPGCSACLGMNPDQVPAGERCAATSNRNFVNRQGPGARTHLLSPAMAAAAAVTGQLTDVRRMKELA